MLLDKIMKMRRKIKISKQIIICLSKESQNLMEDKIKGVLTLCEFH